MKNGLLIPLLIFCVFLAAITVASVVRYRFPSSARVNHSLLKPRASETATGYDGHIIYRMGFLARQPIGMMSDRSKIFPVEQLTEVRISGFGDKPIFHHGETKIGPIQSSGMVEKDFSSAFRESFAPPEIFSSRITVLSALDPYYPVGDEGAVFYLYDSSAGDDSDADGSEESVTVEGPGESTVPLPGSLGLLGSGLGVLVWCRDRLKG